MSPAIRQLARRERQLLDPYRSRKHGPRLYEYPGARTIRWPAKWLTFFAVWRPRQRR